MKKKSLLDDDDDDDNLSDASDTEKAAKKPLFSFSFDDDTTVGSAASHSSAKSSTRGRGNGKTSPDRNEPSVKKEPNASPRSPRRRSPTVKKETFDDVKMEEVAVKKEDQDEEADPLDAFMQNVDTEAEKLVQDAAQADQQYQLEISASASSKAKESLFSTAPGEQQLDEPEFLSAEQDLMQVAADVLNMQQDVRKDVIAVDHEKMDYEPFR